MKNSEELAQECWRFAGDDFIHAIANLTKLIERDRAKQREACAKAAVLAKNSGKSIYDACINAGVEE